MSHTLKDFIFLCPEVALQSCNFFPSFSLFRSSWSWCTNVHCFSSPPWQREVLVLLISPGESIYVWQKAFVLLGHGTALQYKPSQYSSTPLYYCNESSINDHETNTQTHQCCLLKLNSNEQKSAFWWHFTLRSHLLMH